jgi:dihydrofolate reductase
MSEPTRVVLYVALSLDGYIAEADGGVGFLDSVREAESDYEEFVADVGSLVMGRRTYDQVLGWGWPYEGKPTAVVTRRPLGDAPAGVFANDGHDLRALVDDLAARAEGAIWLVGGGEVAGAFFRGDLVDELRLSVVPVLLGEGVPLWAHTGRRDFTLTSCDDLGAGMARLRYGVKRA